MGNRCVIITRNRDTKEASEAYIYLHWAPNQATIVSALRAGYAQANALVNVRGGVDTYREPDKLLCQVLAQPEIIVADPRIQATGVDRPSAAQIYALNDEDEGVYVLDNEGRISKALRNGAGYGLCPVEALRDAA